MPRFFVALLFLLSFPLFAASPSGAPILAYHQVAADPQSGWAMRSTDFREQMESLAACSDHVIPIEELVDFIDGKRDALPPHSVVITDDDGWLSTYTDTDPILRRFGYPYSIYIYTAIVGKGADSMTWPQVVELARRGVDVECHTVTHPHLTHRSHPEMSDAAYATWLHAAIAVALRLGDDRRIEVADRRNGETDLRDPHHAHDRSRIRAHDRSRRLNGSFDL